MSGKPNLFQLSTKELTQDGFFTWLISWGDDSFKNVHPKLNEVAKHFIQMLIRSQHPPGNINVKSVIVKRQWNKIDICADINSDYCIAIEDKTNSREHGNQLEKYMQVVKKERQGKKHCFVYLKTGNECSSGLEKIKGKGWAIIDRKQIIRCLSTSKVDNDIYDDFINYLTAIEDRTNAPLTIENITGDWLACQGLFLKIEDRIKRDDLGWGYVANQSGGFMGLWYNYLEIRDYVIYMQLENSMNKEKGLELKIKVHNKEKTLTTAALYEIFNALKDISAKNGLLLEKPSRLNVGNTSTVGIVRNAFVFNNHLLEFDAFIDTLKKAEKVLGDFKSSV
jgi:hypothetical protein